LTNHGGRTAYDDLVSFVCGVIQHRPSSLLDKGFWGWPFGRVALGPEEIRAYTPVFFGRFSLHIPYGAIAGAVATSAWPGGRLRLLRTGESGDVTILTFNNSYRTIAEVLRKNGVAVKES